MRCRGIHRIRQATSVGVNDSLRATRRTGRVDDVGNSVDVDVGERHGVEMLSADHRIPREDPIVVARSRCDHTTKVAVRARPRVERADRSHVADQRSDIGVGQDPASHRWWRQRVDRNHHRAGAQDRMHRLERLVVLRSRDCDAVADRDPDVDESCRDAPRPAVDIAPGEPFGVTDDRKLFGPLSCRGWHQRGEAGAARILSSPSSAS